MVVRLRSLGQCLIETPATRLGPEAEILFATGLYLVVERGRRIPREAIAQLLWPDVRPARAGHCLRQAFYKLRSLGVPLAAGRMDVTLPTSAVEADYAALFEAHEPRAAERIAERVGGGFLAGYAPTFSSPFAEWLEQQRDAINSAIRRILVSAIVARKQQFDWSAVEVYARRCAALDPLNEEATLALAESAALHGSKTEALRILDQYLKEIGSSAREIRLPAVALRRRVSEATSSLDTAAASQSPFVGRESEIALLGSALAQAHHGVGSAYLLWGEAGIGKTRLVHEFLRVAELQGRHTIRVACQSHDSRRPLSALVDAVPMLLSLPGALGCSPESMRCLRRIQRHSSDDQPKTANPDDTELAFLGVRRAFLDLLDAVTSEVCVIIVIEDVHWLDSKSWELLGDIVPWLGTRRALLLLTYRTLGGVEPPTVGLSGLSHHCLASLDASESRNLVRSILDSCGRDVHPEFSEWCLAAAGGNPFYLTELARHGLSSREGFRAPASLDGLIAERLRRLKPATRRALQACAVLGKYCTLDRLEAVLGQSSLEMLDSLDELQSQGIIDFEAGRVLSRHELLSQASLDQASSAAIALLHRHSAMALERDVAASQSSSILWECAEHWQRAGDVARALTFLERCAGHALDLGMPLQAAEIHARAGCLATTPEARALFLTRQAEALCLAGSWELLPELVRLVREIENAVRDAPLNVHDDLELLSLEADWRTGADIAQTFSDLRSCVDCTEASSAHRLRAGTLALMLADGLCLATEADSIISCFNSLVSSNEDSNQLLYVQLVYHSSFGDQGTAAACATRLVELSRASRDTPRLCHSLRHAAVAFRFAGQTIPSMTCALESFELASKHRLGSAATAAATKLVWLYLHLGDLANAEYWYPIAYAWAAKTGESIGLTNIFSRGAELAFRGRRYAEAEELLTRSEACLHGGNDLRSQARTAAMKVLLHVRARQAIARQEVDDLLALHEATKYCNDHDVEAVALYEGLSATGYERQAASVVLDFTTRYRRERSALDPELDAIVRSGLRPAL